MDLSVPVVTAITVAAGVFGIVLGAFLKPVFEDWFARRRKTLRVRLGAPSEIRSPHDTVVMHWQTHKFSTLHNLHFEIENLSGRTIRDFNLHFEVTSKSCKDDFAYIVLSECDDARFKSNDNEGTSFSFDFQFIEPSARVSGYLLSSYAKRFSAFTLSDLELRVIDDRESGFLPMYLKSAAAGVATAAAISSIAGAALALLGN